MVKVQLIEFTVPKKTHYGTIERSMGQDKVFIWNDDTGNWTHCGYLTHSTNIYLPLVGVPHELVPAIAEQCAKEKKVQVKHVESVPLEEPVPDYVEEEWSDDE